MLLLFSLPEVYIHKSISVDRIAARARRTRVKLTKRTAHRPYGTISPRGRKPSASRPFWARRPADRFFYLSVRSTTSFSICGRRGRTWRGPSRSAAPAAGAPKASATRSKRVFLIVFAGEKAGPRSALFVAPRRGPGADCHRTVG